MKFEFISEEEWETLPDPAPQPPQGNSPQGDEQPPTPAALIAAAAERMHTRARTDLNRLHSSLNHMLYAVEASLVQPGLTFAETGPEPGVDVFRPEAFGPGPVEAWRG